MRPLFWFLAVTMAFSATGEVAFATSLSLAACWTKLPLLQIDGLYDYMDSLPCYPVATIFN